MDSQFVENLSLGDRIIDAKKPDNKKKPLAPKHAKGELFLCGPIPWNWLTHASQKGGKGSAIQVALAIWFLSGLNHKSATVKLTRKTLKSLGVERNAGYRGLQSLEISGLVSVVRKKGACPIVTILKLKHPESTENTL